MSARRAADPDRPDDLSSDLDRQATAEDEGFVVDVPQPLESRRLGDQLSHLTGWPAQAGGGIGLLAAAVSRVGTRPVSSHQHLEHARPVHHRHAHAIAVLLALFLRGSRGLIRQRERQRRFTGQLLGRSHDLRGSENQHQGERDHPGVRVHTS